MSDNASVIVFPTDFSYNKINILISNIKKILKLQNQKYSSIRRDDSVIVIDANDPVFASSAINLLFGIRRIAIAKKVKNEFDTIVSGITRIGSNLLLKGEKFYVQVEGKAAGYLPKDVELAATSSLIEKAVKINAKPGTLEKHDKLLYTFLTKSNAYVCIYTDEGQYGVPYNSQKDKTICCVYNELSAVSCIETIKQGFDIKLVVCYKKESEILALVKMINQIIPRMIQSKIEIEFFCIPIKGSNSKNFLLFIDSVTEILIEIAKSNKIGRVSLALSPLIFPLSFIDMTLRKIAKKDLVPHYPLYGLDNNIFSSAKEIGLEKYFPKIKKFAKMKFMDSIVSQKQTLANAKNGIKTKKTVLVKLGPNNVHDMLDSLKQEH